LTCIYIVDRTNDLEFSFGLANFALRSIQNLLYSPTNIALHSDVEPLFIRKFPINILNAGFYQID